MIGRDYWCYLNGGVKMDKGSIFLTGLVMFFFLTFIPNFIDPYSTQLTFSYYMVNTPFYVWGGIATLIISALAFAGTAYYLRAYLPTFFGGNRAKIYLAISAVLALAFYYFTFATTSLNLFAYIEMNGFLYTFFSMLLNAFIIALSSILFIDLGNFLRNLTKAETSTSLGGSLASLFSLGCPTCGSIIYSMLGIVGGLTILPLKGLEVKLLSLALLMYGTYLLYKRFFPDVKINLVPSANTALIALLVLALPIFAYGQFQLMEISSSLGGSQVGGSSSPALGPASSFSSANLEGVDVYSVSSTPEALITVFPELKNAKTEQDVIGILYPRGAPTYSQVLGGINYDDPVNSMEYLSRYYFAVREDIRKNKPEVWNRYINLAAAPRGISCEFCCGVGPQGIDSQGNLRCGCKHNVALQGLVLGLMSNTDLSDAEILREVMKWKTLFFPRNMVALGVQLAGNDASSLSSLPGMVGGC